MEEQIDGTDGSPSKKRPVGSLKEYMDKGYHVCPPSPTGSHHWADREANEVPGVPDGWWACQHCWEIRRRVEDGPGGKR